MTGDESAKGVRHQLRELAGLIEIGGIILIAYVVLYAPVLVLTGEASLRDFLAGVVGIAFWAFAALTFAGWSP